MYQVRNWALKFGVDLWEFGRQFTKMNEIRNKYKDLDGEVIRKNGIILLRELTAEVKNFMDFKMNSVLRVMETAEQAALSESERDSAHHHHQVQSQVSHRLYETRHINDYMSDDTKDLPPKPIRRFEKLIVNLTHSSVLAPAGISLSDSNVQSSVAWSAHLDPIFANNLERDAALSWQYFGSTAGFMRRFPGTPWPHTGSTEKKPINDFRTQDWFIQAASSPKDIMILLDASGSMSGKSFDLAITMVSAILDTLSDNDYVNLIAFSDKTRSVVPCFKDKMVRAYADNIKEMKDAVKAIKCENVANFTAGMQYGFEILNRYNQSSLGSQCNQAIMLITDGTTETHSEIIKRYNWPHRPVRIFTYLIGGASGSRDSMQTIACTNKGFYAQINSPEDARARVVDYALVMARPMVLYQADHPIHWSPVFVGGPSGNIGYVNERQRRLVTTVSTPVFDRRNHSLRQANLLGVVGADVSIEEIVKMIPQYKLGANGYSFIVDNNGKVLYHPDLRLLDDKSQYVNTLQPKYSVTDLTEVELPESDANGMANGDTERENENSNMLLDMRHEMVLQKEGEMEFSLLTHSDDMKRVSTRTQRYFYGPIDGTPFTLAIALPDKYGMYELSSQEEIRHSHQNVTEYLKGTDWRVHPDWVYCEYNSLYDFAKERENSGETSSSNDERTSFETAEDQVLHFLARAGRPRWKWMSVRPRSPVPHFGHNGASPNGGHHAHHNGNNGQGSRKAEPYYCDRYLVQSLVRDAKVTDELDQPSHPPRREDKHPIATLMALLHRQGYQMFGIKLSFVATRSGLLRWKDHIEHDPSSPDPHFGEVYAKAMDSTWYKRAVDQHSIEPDSFVFSVPFDSGYTGKSNATLVTAAHAIFIDHRGHNKAPAAVVGLQYQHDSLARHFKNITSACTGMGNCRKTCASDELDCYVLDNNGFVIISESTEHTGKFFGHIDGTIMDSLVQDRIYRRVSLMNYQGLCSDRENPYTAAGDLTTRPNHHFSWLFKYIVSFATTWISLLPNPVQSWPHYSEQYMDHSLVDESEDETYPDEYDDEAAEPNDVVEQTTEHSEPEEKSQSVPKATVSTSTPAKVVPDASYTRPCDLKTDLFVLQPDRLNSSTPLKGKLTNCHSSGCERPFSVQKIPHSNLILLVVDTLCPCGSKQLDIGPQEVTTGAFGPGGIAACNHRRMTKERLPRKRPTKCINYHPEEIEIQQCGGASTLLSGWAIFLHILIVSQVWILSA
ncbi:voltage-dependent calcium channel subunit alpha-2/delta-4 [Contarinia nasturtii]|uniref:voltage-dependent calcium channel subunit alpha-2/delta-4 n=1 Tax=Contarinia nasturtii TaxID=265458 RepID=UPI0012D40386|nr:voltage-dependent calcium channel subunit alpha-2/delta-4 [Contarinia nasturtii]